MERFDMSRNKKLIKNESSFNSKLENENLKLCLSSYKNGGFTEVTSQVEMITDSLQACLQMSKCRPLLKKPRLASETFIQTQKETPCLGENTMYVTYMLRQDNWYKKFEEWNSIISQEVLIDSNSKNCSFKDLPESVSQKTLKTGNQADPISMVDIIQGELQTLTSLAPSASRTAANLSQWISHYKECTRCHEKISLLEILHRIQELNLYIAKKSRKTHNRSTQSKEKAEKSVHELKKNISIKSGSFEKIIKEGSKERQVEKSQVLDPAAIAEGNPGVQILLEIDPGKKFFLRVEKELWEIQKNFSSTQVNDFSCTSGVQKTKDKSADFISPKLYSFGTFFAPAFFARSPDSILVLNNSIGVCRTVKRNFEKTRKIFFLYPVPSCAKQSLRLTVNFCIIFFKKIGCLSIPRTLDQRKEDLRSDDSSDSVPNSLKELLEKMDYKIVEEEVAALRNLLMDIQQSQVKLSKVLLNEGIFSQPLLKLTSPNLVEEESKALRKLSEVGNSPFESTSPEDLQDILNNLKEKCSFKNRLIGTVMRGLQHNIPKQWWEEIVGYTFEGSNTLKEHEYEKVDGLLRQCSSYFKQQEKAMVQQLPPEQSEEMCEDERPSEEESNMKDIARASTQDNSKTFSRCEERDANTRSSWMFPDVEKYSSNQTTIGQQSTRQQPPRENQTNVRDRWMKSLENQISMLSVENTKLWEEIHALRDSVENSAKDVSVKKAISVSNRQSLQDIYTVPGKTINVTVQISSDKTGRRSKDLELLKLHKYNDTDEDGHSRTSKISLKRGSEYSKRSEQRDSNTSRRSSLADTKAKLQINSDRRRSQNDLNYLDDFSPSAPEQDNRDYMAIAKDRVTNRESNSVVQQMAIKENPEVYNILKETKAREFQKCQKPGPSQKNLEIDYILQRPSLVKLGGSQITGMQATMSNERELQPIMENDHPDFASSFCSSSSLCQAVQQLRARVRSIHKEVTVLKSKNDRIDKLLDKLLDDAVDNNKSFEEIENNLKNFRRLD